MNNLRSVGIASVGAYTPAKRLTNFDLEKMIDTSDEWIRTRTGIKERRIVENGVCTSDMGVIAARMALERAGVSPDEVDLIITGTATPDMFFPSTGCIIQDKLGASKAAAFDLEAGCTGFVYSIAVGAQFVQTGLYKNVLVVGSDTLSKVTDWTDRNTCVLFGDGAGAVLLKPVPEGTGILSLYLGADGSGGELLKIPGGGSKHPANKESVEKKQHYIKMAGNEVFKFATRIMEVAALEAIKRSGLTVEDVSCFIPHQANVRIIEAAAKRLRIPMDKVFVNVSNYGNTSNGSIPIALFEAQEQGRIKKGDAIVIVAFGAGLTWASSVIRW
ncbi:MAG: ketoacyl-ACP synthase III [Firmicutes bacterium]|nr:ketoacyl-ACP synthase III [Bacillota bacterium]